VGSKRRAIAIANGAHVLHDGLSDLLYVFFPIWQAALGLDYAAVGAPKACYSGAMALFQLAATRLAGRLGHGAVATRSRNNVLGVGGLLPPVQSLPS
jgi:FSR family fosmidomycin resistance protein-like MFS transporter